MNVVIAKLSHIGIDYKAKDFFSYTHYEQLEKTIQGINNPESFKNLVGLNLKAVELGIQAQLKENPLIERSLKFLTVCIKYTSVDIEDYGLYWENFATPHRFTFEEE